MITFDISILKEFLVDVTFVVGREEEEVEEIKAHTVMLAMASEVFTQMLKGPMATAGEPIRILDIDADVFRQMLKYVRYFLSFNRMI